MRGKWRLATFFTGRHLLMFVVASIAQSRALSPSALKKVSDKSGVTFK